MFLLIKWLVLALTLVLIANLIPGIEVDSFGVALVAGLVIGLINLVIRPLLQILSLPITILTLGLFGFILNALMFWLAAALVPGFEIDGFIPALFGSILMTLIYTLFERIITPHPAR